jgi:hypothetical protein
LSRGRQTESQINKNNRYIKRNRQERHTDGETWKKTERHFLTKIQLGFDMKHEEMGSYKKQWPI